MDSDWSDLAPDAHLAFLLRGKEDSLDLYLDYAAMQLQATLNVQGYWETMLNESAIEDEFDPKIRTQAEENAAAVLDGISNDRALMSRSSSLRTKLKSSPKS